MLALLLALLTIAVLEVLARLPFFLEEKQQVVTVTEKNGIYDLTEVSDLQEVTVNLLPDSLYYPNVYLTPETADTTIPTSTDLYDRLGAEYLSQRFVLAFPDDSRTYLLTFILSGRHALRVYVNGRLEAQTGTPGTTKQGTEVWENNITFYASAVDGKMKVILNSAQFYHAKRGASFAELSVSSAQAGTDPFAPGRIKGLLLMGALLCAASLLLSIYFLLFRAKATLYFALACLAMVLRECLQSQAWVYFPIPGNLSFMLEYLSVVLLTVFLSLYLGQYAKGRFLRGIQCVAIAGSLLYGSLVLFGDSVFYTSVLGYYQVFLILCIVPGISVLLWRMRHPSVEQATAMYGIAVFFLSAISDIIMYSDILGESPNAPISEAAMLVFVLAQTISLFLMNNRVLAEAKEAEHKLAAEKNALENLNRMKTEFLGNVSHELKTPLTVMSGYAQTTRQLIEKPGAPDVNEISRRMLLISSETERLSLMVSQILDVTRMEEGRMAMEPVRCYVDEIIHGAVETHYPMLNKNNNRLDIRIDGILPSVNADPARISQVIVNLISNAARYTRNGLITIYAIQVGADILVCVSDTGDGIAQDRLFHIFERYGDQKKSGGGKNTGTGLGLYICKHIVEQHGGKIWLESEEGKGTSVFFTLPVPQNPGNAQ